jgi:hypothetical protein
MTGGRIIDNIKYMCLHNDNELKKRSLEDNVYFTMRDIYLNTNSADIAFEVNDLNYGLSNGIRYEDRDNTFQYANVLHNKKYLLELITSLVYLCKDDFVFKENKPKLQSQEYIKFDDWWVQFKKLKILLNKQYKKIL